MSPSLMRAIRFLSLSVLLLTLKGLLTSQHLIRGSPKGSSWLEGLQTLFHDALVADLSGFIICIVHLYLLTAHSIYSALGIFPSFTAAHTERSLEEALIGIF